jgi:hypothetical protein
LLNKYIGILEKSEDVARVIFDERWHGAELVRHISALHTRRCFKPITDVLPHRTKSSSSAKSAKPKNVHVAKRRSAYSQRRRRKNAGNERHANASSGKSGNALRRRKGRSWLRERGMVEVV